MLGTVHLVKPVAGEVIGPRKESFTLALLNGHKVKLPSKYSC